MVNEPADIQAGIIEVCKAVPDLDESQVYAEEPTSVDAPAVYVVLDTFEVRDAGQVDITDYSFLVRFLAKRQDPAYAEAEMLKFLHGFLTVWRGQNAQGQSARTLYGLIARGIVKLTGGVAAYINLGGAQGITYRALDMTVSVLDKSQ